MPKKQAGNKSILLLCINNAFPLANPNSELCKTYYVVVKQPKYKSKKVMLLYIGTLDMHKHTHAHPYPHTHTLSL